VTAPTPLERLEQALAELGALTPDGIADRMRALGIKGVREKSCECPLARYLDPRGIDGVRVSPHFGPTWVAWFMGTVVEVTLPSTVAEFAVRFDRGVYLDLVAVDGGAADE
jgi:hypothetical protein